MVTGPIKEHHEFPYKVNDKVQFLGATGVIIDADADPLFASTYPIKVQFDSGRVMVFTKDGHYAPDMTEAKLEVIGRAKRKVKKWRWVMHEQRDGGKRVWLHPSHMTKEQASSLIEPWYIAQKIDSTMIEVEVDHEP